MGTARHIPSEEQLREEHPDIVAAAELVAKEAQITLGSLVFRGAKVWDTLLAASWVPSAVAESLKAGLEPKRPYEWISVEATVSPAGELSNIEAYFVAE